MRDAVTEILVVLAYSTRTQLAILMGFIFFVGILWAGDYFASRLVLHGFLAPLTDALRQKLVHRYDVAAWGAFAGFFLLAFRYYRKDRRRLLGL